MKINLREIIEIPGASIPFSCELSGERLDFPAVKRFLNPPKAAGEIVNSAGALTLRGELAAEMVCVCDRCTNEFESTKTIELDVQLATELVDEDNADIFLLDGDLLNLSEVLETVLILDMETRFLCRPDCAGLCPDCGANLNSGPCGCRKKIDPRMAVLEQLLDNKED